MSGDQLQTGNVCHQVSLSISKSIQTGNYFIDPQISPTQLIVAAYQFTFTYPTGNGDALNSLCELIHYLKKMTTRRDIIINDTILGVC